MRAFRAQQFRKAFNLYKQRGYSISYLWMLFSARNYRFY
nr:MAG TPA: hypothetical protein [Caudoviricetes sp.]